MAKKKCNAKASFACGPRNAVSPQKFKTAKRTTPEATAKELFWPAGLTPYPFQIEAIDKVIPYIEKDRAVYLALDPGLGKTICAAIILNKLNAKRPTLAFYICPPFLTSNTAAEFDTWVFNSFLLHVIPDSRLVLKGRGRFNPKRFSTAVQAMKDQLAEWDGDVILFVDEAHRFKNEDAKRTQALMKQILPHFKKVVWMSGTPIPNSRAKEIWPILYNSAPKIFGRSFFPYGTKYCAGYKDEFGWKFDGFTNRQEWKARITRTFMVRMKKDVLNLPPKMEGLLTVGENLPPVISKLERDILKKYSPKDLVEGKIAKKAGVKELHLMTYLRLLGEHKVKHAIPVIENMLEDTKENLLIFAVHKETIKKLQYALADYNPLVITGDVPVGKRQALVNLYQTDKSRRVFLLNIDAGGVGYTLTKADRVLFVEFGWVDGINTQASDRAHRIGRKGTVWVQYFVLQNSIDRKRMELLLNKRKLSI